MKKILILTAFLSCCLLSESQNRTLPRIDLKTLDNITFNSSEFNNDGKPIVISFWATWCKPCIKELNNIAEVYEDWQEETGVKVIAVSIDDARNMSKVKPKVNALLWDYEIYCDPNGDFKRAMGVGTVPHTFLLNENKEIVYQHTGYKDGDEYDLFKKIEALLK
ncbi:MAG: alkyl hydroperoxide reductase [Flavobacteriales bacterium]|nr:alkyl hydroperoxide reductase [Flavobacteriales bacterium]|tara:strand:+ start:6786 stop:7277 length:492 start_codon:yes stop_codon:yes gene_type:complete